MNREQILRQLHTLEPIILQLFAMNQQTALLERKLTQLEGVVMEIPEDEINIELADLWRDKLAKWWRQYTELGWPLMKKSGLLGSVLDTDPWASLIRSSPLPPIGSERLGGTSKLHTIWKPLKSELTEFTSVDTSNLNEKKVEDKEVNKEETKPETKAESSTLEDNNAGGLQEMVS